MNKSKDEPTESGGNKYWKNKEEQLHRIDGPAIEYADGTKSWWINGKLHREDGPAIIHADGTKSWWINGKNYTEDEFNKEILNMNKAKDEPTGIDSYGNKYWRNKEGQLHRINGPAYEYTDGDKHWYLNGKSHRLDGPAIELANGSKQWYLNGQRHRIDGPAIEFANGNKEWWINGKKYSVAEFNKEILNMNKAKDEPTEINSDGTKIWRNKEGQLHREDGPAYEGVSGHRSWWVNGERHRIDGPAVEYADGSKIWYLNGLRHREDGPAIEDADGGREWWVNGRRYYVAEFNKEILNMNKAKDEPTEIDSDGNKFWRNKKGQYHREDGPAIEGADGDKHWYINGQYHRIDGPAAEHVNGYKAWWINGLLHREDGPAIEDTNGTKQWYINGFLHREDGPAKEYADGSKTWYINGKLHRIDGPAVERADGYKAWWVDGLLHREDGSAYDGRKNVEPNNIKENHEYKIDPTILELKKRIDDLENIIKEKDRVIESSQKEKDSIKMSKVIEPTTTLLSNVGINSMRLVGARQTSKVLVSLVRFLLVTIAKKMGKDNYEEYIDSEPGKVTLEIISPLIIHSLAANKFFPKFTEQIEAISRLSVEANITYYSLHYSDKISDIGKEILSNKETREQIKNLISLGSDIIKPNEVLEPSFEKNLDKILMPS